MTRAELIELAWTLASYLSHEMQRPPVDEPLDALREYALHIATDED
jgi:hypothetical protein